MLIDREVDYAIRIIRALLDRQLHPMKPLCEEEEIPWKFAYKIIRKLKDAGIVTSVSGVHGGCRLIRDPADITLLELIEVLAPDRSYISDCMKPGYECNWTEKKCERCTVNSHLRQIQNSIARELKGHTLQEMFEDGPQESGS